MGMAARADVGPAEKATPQTAAGAGVRAAANVPELVAMAILARLPLLVDAEAYDVYSFQRADDHIGNATGWGDGDGWGAGTGAGGGEGWWTRRNY